MGSEGREWESQLTLGWGRGGDRVDGAVAQGEEGDHHTHPREEQMSFRAELCSAISTIPPLLTDLSPPEPVS